MLSKGKGRRPCTVNTSVSLRQPPRSKICSFMQDVIFPIIYEIVKFIATKIFVSDYYCASDKILSRVGLHIVFKHLLKKILSF